MKSITKNFLKTSKEEPSLSTYLCFVRAIKDRNYRKRTISKWFNRLVDKDDYDPKETTSIIHDLWLLSCAAKSFQQGGTKTASKITSKQGEKAEWYPTRVGALAAL